MRYTLLSFGVTEFVVIELSTSTDKNKISHLKKVIPVDFFAGEMNSLKFKIIKFSEAVSSLHKYLHCCIGM